jgi:hypothetical protein
MLREIPSLSSRLFATVISLTTPTQDSAWHYFRHVGFPHDKTLWGGVVGFRNAKRPEDGDAEDGYPAEPSVVVSGIGCCDEQPDVQTEPCSGFNDDNERG